MGRIKFLLLFLTNEKNKESIFFKLLIAIFSQIILLMFSSFFPVIVTNLIGLILLSSIIATIITTSSFNNKNIIKKSRVYLLFLFKKDFKNKVKEDYRLFKEILNLNIFNEEFTIKLIDDNNQLYIKKRNAIVKRMELSFVNNIFTHHQEMVTKKRSFKYSLNELMKSDLLTSFILFSNLIYKENNRKEIKEDITELKLELL